MPTLNVDIRIDEDSSCKSLVVKDYSSYTADPTEPVLQIQLPGRTTWHTLDFNFSQINIYNSESFNLTSDDDELVTLSDGLYTIKYGFCPYDEFSYTFYHVRQCQAWCRWETLLKQSIDSCLDISRDAERLLNRIEFLLRGATVYAEDCDPETAIELHQKAVELIERLECTII